MLKARSKVTAKWRGPRESRSGSVPGAKTLRVKNWNLFVKIFLYIARPVGVLIDIRYQVSPPKGAAGEVMSRS